uniref:APX6 n=1 Tax=Arundo donax TaxID=35708 RepID=A0A0A9GCL3_ARUDO
MQICFSLPVPQPLRKQVAPKSPWSMEGLMLLLLNNAHQRGGFLLLAHLHRRNICARYSTEWA